MDEIRKGITEFYGNDVISSPNFSRIVSQRQFQRLKSLIDQGTSEDPQSVIVCGGETDATQKYIAPTVIDNCSHDSPLMSSEIFGPILPIIRINSIDQAIDFINDREKPLAIYLFSRSSAAIERVKLETTSGALLVNDTLLHAVVQDLPFGGVGESGIGAYHGQRSFEIFSHKKAYLRRSFYLSQIDRLRFPPYSNTHLKWLVAIFERPYSANLVTRTVREIIALIVFLSSFILNFLLKYFAK